MALGSGVFVRGPVACRDPEALCFPPKPSKGHKVCRETAWPTSHGIHSPEAHRQAQRTLVTIVLHTPPTLGSFQALQLGGLGISGTDCGKERWPSRVLPVKWPRTGWPGQLQELGACLCRAGCMTVGGGSLPEHPQHGSASNCCPAVALSHPGRAALCMQRPQGVGCSLQSSGPIPRHASLACCVGVIDVGCQDEPVPRRLQFPAPCLCASPVSVMPEFKVRNPFIVSVPRGVRNYSKARGWVGCSLFLYIFFVLILERFSFLHSNRRLSVPQDLGAPTSPDTPERRARCGCLPACEAGVLPRLSAVGDHLFTDYRVCPMVVNCRVALAI